MSKIIKSNPSFRIEKHYDLLAGYQCSHYLIKNKPPTIAVGVNKLYKDTVLYMSFISYAKLLKGTEKSTRKAETLQHLKRLTQQITVNYQISSTLCEHYVTQFIQLKEAGTPIGANDLWIACPCAMSKRHAGYPQPARV